MKSTLILIFLLMITSASALHSGEVIVVDLPSEPTWYEVTGNSSNLDGLSITENNSQLIISVAENMYPDNFTITVYKNGTQEVVEEVNGGGGGSSSGTWNYYKKKVEPKKNTTIATKTPEVIPVEPEATPEVIPEEEDYLPLIKMSLWFLIITGIIGAVIITMIIKVMFKNDEFELNDEDNTN